MMSHAVHLGRRNAGLAELEALMDKGSLSVQLIARIR